MISRGTKMCMYHPSYRSLGSDICRFQQTNQTSLDVNELVFLYMVAKLLSTCAKVLHYMNEIRKSMTKSNR